MTVTVIIPAHNEETTIQHTIESCLEQTYPIKQLFVVADNCTDATATLARQAGATVIEGKGGSKAEAQNLALPHVTSDVVVAIDADATLSTHALEFMVDTIQNGAAGTCISAMPHVTNTIYSQYRTLYHAIANGWVRKMQDILGRQLVLSGMANGHRTDVLRQLGGFPSDTVTEDFNLTWMLHRRGYPVRFTPNATVYTQEPTSLSEMLAQLHRWTSGFAQSMAKHRAPMLDAESFVVVSTQVVDSFTGGLATLSSIPFIRRYGIASIWKWWGALWAAITVASVGVAISEVGPRKTLKCLPAWFAIQTFTGPINAWWLFREWVLGRHLTTWTGRHGHQAGITPMTSQRKFVLALCTAVVIFVRWRRSRGSCGIFHTK